MSYVSENLAPGEEILLQPRYHWVRFVPGASVAVLGALLAAAGAVFVPAAGGGETGAGTDGLSGRAAFASVPRVPVEERLKEAERLFKAGVLSEAEYQEKRQALIREL